MQAHTHTHRHVMFTWNTFPFRRDNFRRCFGSTLRRSHCGDDDGVRLSFVAKFIYL